MRLEVVLYRRIDDPDFDITEEEYEEMMQREEYIDDDDWDYSYVYEDEWDDWCGIW